MGTFSEDAHAEGSRGGGGNARGNLANRGIREDKIAVFQYFVSATDRKARISG